MVSAEAMLTYGRPDNVKVSLLFLILKIAKQKGLILSENVIKVFYGQQNYLALHSTSKVH